MRPDLYGWRNPAECRNCRGLIAQARKRADLWIHHDTLLHCCPGDLHSTDVAIPAAHTSTGQCGCPSCYHRPPGTPYIPRAA